ncbi:MAG: Crp/Fnr family transcriptional regulator [Cytophagaceae bacterium]|jgi:CRP-like cAMP-binding protein|nr:Crp/Fnr family transcriptional regulator [Cytophagaceae bacterium]
MKKNTHPVDTKALLSELTMRLKTAFDPFFNAPIETWQDFAAAGSVITVSKNTVLKEAGTREKYFYFILEGSAAILLEKEDQLVCLDLVMENSFFADYMSLLQGAPSPLQTRCIEASRLLRMSREEYMQLGSTEMGMILTRAAAESSYMAKQQQQIDLLTKTAEQRYLELLQFQPALIQRIPQKWLASFLGVTPQSLSRMRRQLAE